MSELLDDFVGYEKDIPAYNRSPLGCSYTQEYRSGHNEAVLKTVRPKATGVRIPLPAPKNKDTPCGCPLFFATVRGDEPEGFAYRRHTAYHEAQSIRGICVARRCSFLFVLCGTDCTILTPSSISLFERGF